MSSLPFWHFGLASLFMSLLLTIQAGFPPKIYGVNLGSWYALCYYAWLKQSSISWITSRLVLEAWMLPAGMAVGQTFYHSNPCLQNGLTWGVNSALIAPLVLLPNCTLSLLLLRIYSLACADASARTVLSFRRIRTPRMQRSINIGIFYACSTHSKTHDCRNSLGIHGSTRMMLTNLLALAWIPSASLLAALPVYPSTQTHFFLISPARVLDCWSSRWSCNGILSSWRPCAACEDNANSFL